ncbi:MAG: AAA family ATPase [Bacteroidota bacterium]
MSEQLFIGLLIGFAVAWFIGRSRRVTASTANDAQPLKSSPAPEPEREAVGLPTEKPSLNSLYELVEQLESFLNKTAHPQDLLERTEFQEGVDLLSHPGFTVTELISYGAGDNLGIACMALEALNRRAEEEDVATPLLATINRVYAWPLYYALQALPPSPAYSMIGAVLAQTNDWWVLNQPFQNMLRGFAEQHLALGEVPSFDDRLDDLTSEQLAAIEQLLDALGLEQLEPLRAQLVANQRTRIDVSALNAIGSVWDGDREANPIIEHPALKLWLLEMEATLLETSQRSILLTGEPGVGKTTLYSVFARRCQRKGWVIFEAGSTEILAGQSYVGQLEARMQELFKNLSGNRKVIWIIPSFHELLFAGWHRDNPRSVLDMLMPYLENGSLTIIGETEPDAYERLIERKPQLRAVMQRVHLNPLDNEETMAVANAWNQACQDQKLAGPISSQIMEEAFHLAQQYLDKAVAPGNLIDFLKLAQLTDHDPHDALTIDDLFESLSQLTGLPASILDERQALELDALHDLFQSRVLGQPEAVDCLVERVAMMKAGVNDPSRPAGVFLFVGPTGTGKTEIAKTLAEFLFGSSERMIRLDMSEFMTEDSLHRLLGSQQELASSNALVNQIRKQPFSVILLDEFEKAHPNIWDLFLQVFDDGRLTDRRGNTADFRHSIIILTSNLGAAIPRGSQLGFSGDRKTFSESSVTRAVSSTFRPEFLNRIDRTVVFRPLGKGVVRDILLKELRTVLKRRGLRNRDWAVEMEDSALEFLLEKGFTTDLGARPLKRAIERYLLSPLAITIVNNQFPEGDQFLFVRSNGRAIEVEFIDPDASSASEDGRAAGALPDGMEESLKTLILEPAGTTSEVQALDDFYDALAATVDADAWQDKKESALAMTSSPQFWDSEDRFAVLGDVEFQDRFERALDTAQALLVRLRGEPAEERASYSTVLIQRLAQRLFLLEHALHGDAAGEPRDAFICVEPSLEEDGEGGQRFASELSQMYLSWASKRQMRHKILIEDRVDGEHLNRFVLAVAGLGAFPILDAEKGLHVWESPGEGKSFIRSRVRVQVAPQPVVPGDTVKQLLGQAEEAFGALGDLRNIVRRYRALPSPLVRDSLQGWRTGRLERVMDGGFDLITGG